MRDVSSWNIYLHRIAGVRIRLHAFFLLLIVLCVAAREWIPLWYSFSAVGVLFFSVVWHELARCFAAYKCGLAAEQVLLWPLGGLTAVAAPVADPRQEWPTAVAGILANLSVCAVLLPVFLMLGLTSWLQLNPLTLPVRGDQLNWQTAAALVFWVNWGLVLANLLPAYPFDGSRMLRAALWPRLGYRSAVLQVARATRATALLLLLLGLAVSERYPVALVALALLSLFLFFGARNEVDRLQEPELDDGVFGYDFSQGYTSLEHAASAANPKLGALRRWLAQRRENRLRRRREQEELEELRMDEVLARLHELGYERLSIEDRHLLQRVSSRYRNRHRLP